MDYGLHMKRRFYVFASTNITVPSYGVYWCSVPPSLSVYEEAIYQVLKVTELRQE